MTSLAGLSENGVSAYFTTIIPLPASLTSLPQNISPEELKMELPERQPRYSGWRAGGEGRAVGRRAMRELGIGELLDFQSYSRARNLYLKPRVQSLELSVVIVMCFYMIFQIYIC